MKAKMNYKVSKTLEGAIEWMMDFATDQTGLNFKGGSTNINIIRDFFHIWVHDTTGSYRFAIDSTTDFIKEYKWTDGKGWRLVNEFLF